MPKLSFSSVRIILPALAGAAIIIVGTIAGLLVLWQPRGLEAFLPADRTIAFFSDVRWGDLQQFAQQYPSLRRVPTFQDRLSLGVIALPGGTETWVLSARTKDAPLPEKNLTIDRQDFLIDDADVEELLRPKESRLRFAPSFRELTADMNAAAPWIFLKTDAVVASAMLPSPLRPLMNASGAVLLRRDEAGAMLRVWGTPRLDSAGMLKTTLPLLSPPADASLAVSDGRSFLDAWMQALPADERSIREGMLSRRAAELLGGDWSTPYDILPLLAGETSVQWNATGTGGVRLLLRGSTTDAESRMEVIRHRFRNGLAGATVVRRTLDKGFDSAVVHDDPSTVEERSYNAGSWIVREIREHGAGRSLLTAVHGREYILSTDDAWLRQALAGHTPTSFGGGSDAQGTLSAELQQSLLGDLAGNPAWIWLRGASGTRKPGIALWAAEFHGQAMTLSFTLPQL